MESIVKMLKIYSTPLLGHLTIWIIGLILQLKVKYIWKKFHPLGLSRFSFYSIHMRYIMSNPHIPSVTVVRELIIFKLNQTF